MEDLIKPETLEVYNTRLDEGYDLETDEMFCIWAGLKKLSISQDGENENSTPPELPILQEKQSENSPSYEPHPLGVAAVSSALDEVLKYPHPDPGKINC